MMRTHINVLLIGYTSIKIYIYNAVNMLISIRCRRFDAVLLNEFYVNYRNGIKI